MQKIVSLHSWITQLSEPVQADVKSRMKPRWYDNGHAIYELGHSGSELFMLVSGRVRFCNYSASGKEIQFGEVRAGDCFGELSLIDDMPRPHFAYAQGQTELRVLSRSDFEELTKQHPEINAQLVKLLSRRLRVAYTIIEDASVLPMLDRVARLLARLSYSVGQVDSKGVTVLSGFTHESLARMLGCTREAVSRELANIESSGLIQRHYGKLLIPDITALIEASDGIVGGEPIVPGY
jgi:CRP/FNR family cyclic AMP-dependent transcriptional regulator